MANYLWFSKLHAKIYSATDGRIGHKLWHPMVLMHTVGAKSGLVRTSPVQYYPIDDDGIIVLASNNGQLKPPAWWFNIKANPEFIIQVGRERRRVCAEEVDADKRQMLWTKMQALNANIDRYAENSGRLIPVILLKTLDILR
jgi:deazaflavin-dependent oxidoreductase (nitroreductase family)